MSVCGGQLHRTLCGPYLLYYICGGQLHRTLRGPYFLYYICLNTNTEHAQMSTSKENKCYAKEHNQIFEVSTQVQTTKKSLRAGSGRNQFRPDPARKMSANLYDIYHCCVYSEKLLMMDRGTVRNIYSFIPEINLRK